MLSSPCISSSDDEVPEYISSAMLGSRLLVILTSPKGNQLKNGAEILHSTVISASCEKVTSIKVDISAAWFVRTGEFSKQT